MKKGFLLGPPRKGPDATGTTSSPEGDQAAIVDPMQALRAKFYKKHNMHGIWEPSPAQLAELLEGTSVQVPVRAIQEVWKQEKWGTFKRFTWEEIEGLVHLLELKLAAATGTGTAQRVAEAGTVGSLARPEFTERYLYRRFLYFSDRRPGPQLTLRDLVAKEVALVRTAAAEGKTLPPDRLTVQEQVNIEDELFRAAALQQQNPGCLEDYTLHQAAHGHVWGFQAKEDILEFQRAPGTTQDEKAKYIKGDNKFSRRSWLHERPLVGRRTVEEIAKFEEEGTRAWMSKFPRGAPPMPWSRLTPQEEADLEDELFRAVALPFDDLDNLEDVDVKMYVFKLRKQLKETQRADRLRQQMLAAPAAATETRYVATKFTEEGVAWALPHDRTCAVYRAQTLVECFLLSLLETRMMLPQDDYSVAYLMTWLTSTLRDRAALPRVAQDIGNIFGALQVLWPHAEVWPLTCDSKGKWNRGLVYIDDVEHFSYPAAVSIFVYRAASPGERDACSCADAAGVRDSGCHVWLYAQQDASGVSYKWFRHADVRKGAHKQDTVLSEHLIYQKRQPTSSSGPPMRRCTQNQGTVPDAKDAKGLQDRWTLSEPAELCASRLRCKQCGLHQQLEHFATARDGAPPRLDTSVVGTQEKQMGQEFEEFCTVWCKFCLTHFFPCTVCKYHQPQSYYAADVWQRRFQRGATCSLCAAASQALCAQCGNALLQERVRCHKCGQWKGHSDYSDSMWHHKQTSDRTIICLQCEAKNIAKHPCNQCGQSKLQTEFSASMWNNKSRTVASLFAALSCLSLVSNAAYPATSSSSEFNHFGGSYNLASLSSLPSEFNVDTATSSELSICRLLFRSVPRDVLSRLGWTTPSKLLFALRTEPRTLEFAEFFCGQGELTAALYRHGFVRGCALDLDLENDILSVSGFAEFLIVALRLCQFGFAWLAPPCSNFIWMCRGKSLRSKLRPFGDTSRHDVVQANEILRRAVLIIRLLALRGGAVFWVVEQPLSSCMFRLPPWLALFSWKPSVAGFTCQRKFVWVGHFGGPIPKPTELYAISHF